MYPTQTPDQSETGIAPLPAVSNNPTEQRSPSDISLPLKALLVVGLVLFAGAIVGLAKNTGISVAIILIMALALGFKRVRGVLLPYLTGAGVIIAVDHIRYVLSNETQSAAVRNQLAFFSSHSDLQVLMASTALGLAGALGALITTNYGPRLSRDLFNMGFRFLAIWLVLFFSSTAYVLVDRAQLRTGQHQYTVSQSSYDQETLDPAVPVFTASLPPSYTLRSTFATDSDADHKGYESIYDSVGAQHQVTMTVGENKLPTGCENTMTPRVQKGALAQLFSCDIVLTSGNGQPIYGYRDLSSLKYQGIDPLSLTTQQLREIQPVSFYLQKDGVLVNLAYGNPDTQSNPLTQAVVATFADSLSVVDPAARQAFIQTYLKRPHPIKPYAAVSEKQSQNSDIVISVIVAFYLALMSWALEKIFEKARRDYWKVYVPVVDLWILTAIAGRPGWWSLFAWLDTNPFSLGNATTNLTRAAIFPLAVPLLFILTVLRLIIFLIISTSLAERFGKPKIFSLLLIIPPFPGYLILGFGGSKYHTGDLDSIVETPPSNESPPPATGQLPTSFGA